jgi:intein/homing endonuclease
MVKDTPIQLMDGTTKKIRNIEVGDLVKSVNWKTGVIENSEVVAVTRNPDIDKVYTIQTICKNKCSGGHKFFKAENNEVVEIEAKYLNIGDMIAHGSNNNTTFEKIMKIEINDNTEALYDLTVPQNENYIANGMIVHNSTYRVFLRKGKGGKRVARMVDSPETPDMEAILSIGEEGCRDG